MKQISFVIIMTLLLASVLLLNIHSLNNIIILGFIGIFYLLAFILYDIHFNNKTKKEVKNK